MKNNKKILLAISLSAVILPFSTYSMDELTGNNTYKNHDTHSSLCKKLIVDEIDAMEQNNNANQQSTNKETNNAKDYSVNSENNFNNECKLKRQNGKIFDIKNTEQDLDAYKDAYYNNENSVASSRMESDNSDNENLNYNGDTFDRNNNNDDSYELGVTNTQNNYKTNKFYNEYTQFKDNKTNPKEDFNDDEIGSDEELCNDCQPISSNKNNTFGLQSNKKDTINTGRFKFKRKNNKTNNAKDIASLHSISKSNLQYNIPKNNPLMALNTNNTTLSVQEDKIFGKEKYSKKDNNLIENNTINIENLDSNSIYDLQKIIYYFQSEPKISEHEIHEKYMEQFVRLLFKIKNNSQEKINQIVYNSNFLQDLTEYNFYDLKILCDILQQSNVQKFLKEKVRATHAINYSELLNQLNAIKYKDKDCKKLLDIIVVLTAFDNKSFGEFNQSILHSNNTLEKQTSTNELLALFIFSSSFFENYLKNDRNTTRYENLGNLICALKDTIIQYYALRNNDFNIDNIISVINTIIENDKHVIIAKIKDLQNTVHELGACNDTNKDIIKVKNNIQEKQNRLNNYNNNQQNIINLLSKIKLAIFQVKENNKVPNHTLKESNNKKNNSNISNGAIYSSVQQITLEFNKTKNINKVLHYINAANNSYNEEQFTMFKKCILSEFESYPNTIKERVREKFDSLVSQTKSINTNNKQNNIKKGKLLSPEQCAKKIFHDFLQVRKYNSLAFQNIINQLKEYYSNKQINKIIDYMIDKVNNDQNLAYLKDHLIPALGSYKKIEDNNKLSTNSQTSAYDIAQLIINRFMNTNNFDILLQNVQNLRKQYSNTEYKEFAGTISSIVEAADESSKLYPYKQKIINYLLYNEEETANNKQNKNIKNKSLKELISYCDNNNKESLKILTDELVLRKQELKNADITCLDEFIENLMNMLGTQVNQSGLLYKNKDYILNKVIDA